MNILYSLFAVILLILFPTLGVWGLGLNSLFGIVVPYVALATFVAGFIYRVLKWGSAPVPFHIPTVCGQQKSLPWIKASEIDSPSTTKGVVARLALEVLFFRSLFWNERVEAEKGLPASVPEKFIPLAGRPGLSLVSFCDSLQASAPLY